MLWASAASDPSPLDADLLVVRSGIFTFMLFICNHTDVYVSYLFIFSNSFKQFYNGIVADIHEKQMQ